MGFRDSAFPKFESPVKAEFTVEFSSLFNKVCRTLVSYAKRAGLTMIRPLLIAVVNDLVVIGGPSEPEIAFHVIQ